MVAVVFLPRLAAPGTYLDGMVYATIARNLAFGMGTAANPHYTDFLHPSFHEHPPFGLMLESLPFRWLGDHFWIEKSFSMMVLVATMGLICLLWRTWRHGRPRSETWLPVLLWLTMPLCSWLYINALLETTLACFDLAAIACLCAAAGRPRNQSAWWYVAAAAAIAAAFWIKGPQALFPLAWPAIWSLSAGHGWRIATQRTMLMLLAFAACLGITLLFLPARENLTHYLHQQVLSTFAGARGVNPQARVRVLVALASQLAPGAALYVMVLLYRPTRRRALVALSDPHARSFLLIGLCSSLPLLAVSRFSTHYLGPSLPFFALGWAMLLWRPLRLVVSWRRFAAIDQMRHAIRGIAIAVVAVVLVVIALRPDIGLHDPSYHAEMQQLAALLPDRNDIGADPDLADDWRLHAYLARFHTISVDTGHTRFDHQWYLTRSAASPPPGFKRLGNDLSNHHSLWVASAAAAARDRQ